MNYATFLPLLDLLAAITPAAPSPTSKQYHVIDSGMGSTAQVHEIHLINFAPSEVLNVVMDGMALGAPVMDISEATLMNGQKIARLVPCSEWLAEMQAEHAFHGGDA
jgi:hypothetical protein